VKPAAADATPVRAGVAMVDEINAAVTLGKGRAAAPSSFHAADARNWVVSAG
jgi:hypothetical protein